VLEEPKIRQKLFEIVKKCSVGGLYSLSDTQEPVTQEEEKDA
jgi:hypothetical protein